MLVTEEGRKAESSSRFRVTCGTTGTSTDIVAEDCDDALEWVKAIQVVGIYITYSMWQYSANI